MQKSLYGIFKTFFKVGTLLLGGGYVILPLLASELVEKKKWITSEELCEYYAISASLPGVIAANVSIFVGKKLRGTLGAVAAIIGVILPAFMAIVLLATILSELVSMSIVQNLFWGVKIGIIVLLYLAVKEMWKKSVVDKFTLIVYFVCLILALTSIVPLSLIIIGAIVVGVIHQRYIDRTSVNKAKISEVSK